MVAKFRVWKSTPAVISSGQVVRGASLAVPQSIAVFRVAPARNVARLSNSAIDSGHWSSAVQRISIREKPSPIRYAQERPWKSANVRKIGRQRSYECSRRHVEDQADRFDDEYRAKDEVASDENVETVIAVARDDFSVGV